MRLRCLLRVYRGSGMVLFAFSFLLVSFRVIRDQVMGSSPYATRSVKKSPTRRIDEAWGWFKFGEAPNVKFESKPRGRSWRDMTAAGESVALGNLSPLGPRLPNGPRSQPGLRRELFPSGERTSGRRRRHWIACEGPTSDARVSSHTL